jgi:hypothetical protein
MNRRQLAAAAAFLILAGCSQFSSDSSNTDFAGKGFKSDFLDTNTSRKLASQEELEDMEELARIAQDLRNSFGLDLPTGMNRIANISTASSRIDVRTELSNGLANCEVVSATNPNNSSKVRYFTIENSVSEFCDFDVSGAKKS